MPVDPYAGCNATITDWAYCTLDTCCLAQGATFTYIPNYGANIFFCVLWGIMIVPNLYLGIRYKTWGYMAGMICGLVLEILGYASRIMIHDDPWSSNAFLLYLIAITIAPVFLTAAIYLCISRIMVTYGEHLARIQPKFVALGFMTVDFLSLLLQAIGGAIADTADPGSAAQDAGINTMIAGLVLQVVGLATFLLVCADFAWRCKRGVLNMATEKVETRRKVLLKATIVSLVLATVTILIRSIFRVIELWQGFEGHLWNDEVTFMVLDGAMVAIAVICLTAFHPGPGFGGQWHAANWSFRSNKGAKTDSAGSELPMKTSGSDQSSRA